MTSPIFTLSSTRNWIRMTYKNKRSLWSSLFSVKEKMCVVLFHGFCSFVFNMSSVSGTRIKQDVTCRSKSIIENVVDKSIVLEICRQLSIDKSNLSIKVDNHKIFNCLLILSTNFSISYEIQVTKPITARMTFFS